MQTYYCYTFHQEFVYAPWLLLISISDERYLFFFFQIILSFGSKPALANKENATLPDYLPEEDSPIRGLDKAVTKPGMVGDEDKQASWLSTAASFISSSFYW